MILVGIGSNLPGEGHPTPLATCEAAFEYLGVAGLIPVRRSRWYRSAPVPPSDQPWYVNGVVEVETVLEPHGILVKMQRIEADFGRVRGPAGAPRPLDLDLLDMNGLVSDEGEAVTLPHPRLHERAFVLLPLAEVAPAWRHPVSGIDVRELIAALGPDQVAEPMQTASFGHFG